MSDKVIKNIFFGLILFILIGIIYGNVSGKKQDEILLKDYSKYKQAVLLIEKNEGGKAAPLLNELVKKYPDDPNYYYLLGLVESQNNSYKSAAFYYQKAHNLKPSLLQDQSFVYYMGESLYFIGELEKSKVYLSMPIDEKFKAKKDELLGLIERQL